MRKRYVYVTVLLIGICVLLAACGKKVEKQEVKELVDFLENETPLEEIVDNEDTATDTIEENIVISNEQAIEKEVMKIAVINTDAVNIRNLPGDEDGSEVIATADRGEEFEYVAQKDEWIQLVYEGKDAFVKADYVQIEERNIEKQEQLSDKEEYQKESSTDKEKKLIVIDAGHQEKANLEKEPIAPGADEMKAKVAAGTQGTASGLKEYELNLQVALLLQEELQKRGYEVLMIRTTNDVNISNGERAEIANQADADVFIRVHANGSESESSNGMMTICPTAENPYCADIYEQSKLLSEEILEAATKATGANKEKVWETDTMSGINWCQVPVTIVEMGYMTNKEEDLKMADYNYQIKIATGIADGIESYFQKKDDLGGL